MEGKLKLLLSEIEEETGLGAIIARRIFGFLGGFFFLLGFESKNRGEREQDEEDRRTQGSF